MARLKWINSTSKNEDFVIFHFGETKEGDGIMDEVGAIIKWPEKRPFWNVGSSSGTADSIGQAKAIVQKLANRSAK